MGRMKGLELSTFGTTNRRSNQLSYIRHNSIDLYPIFFTLSSKI